MSFSYISRHQTLNWRLLIHLQHNITMKLFLHLIPVFILSTVFLACGGGSTSESTEDSAVPDPTEATEDFTVHDPTEVTIRPRGDEMKFETDTVYVPVGTEITLILENTATLPTMVHNAVVLATNNDDDVERVGIAAIQAGADSDYLPVDDAIIAATPMAQPGETVRRTFTTPSAPGVYRFICTYPGHYAAMQGVLIVGQ